MITNRLAVVTGAGRTAGIGFEVARQLGALGITVILTARDGGAAKARADELAGLGLPVVGRVLDVNDEASVGALAEVIGRDHERLDILINNAAATSAYGEVAATADLAVARETLETTLFGSWRVVQALLPLLSKSEHPRIVNVSSGAGSHADQVFGLTTDNAMGVSYAVSKAALNALTARLAHENPGVLINAVCPGFTATFEGGEAMGARPVKDGAASVVWAALLPDDGPTGGFFRDGAPLGW